jgi:DNA polymerase III sliding clamp (beta) subunit (PCNA family)
MNAQTLLKQLDFVGAVIENNPVVPVLEHVLVDKGEMIGSNLHTTLICKTELDGTSLLPFKALRKVVSILPKDIECKLIFDNPSERVMLKTPSGKFIFNDIPSDSDFPKLPIRQEVEVGVLNSLDLSRIGASISFASNDQLRPSLCGVYLGKQVVATDGHRLAWFDYSGALTASPLLIEKKAASILSTFGTASVRYDGLTWAEFHNSRGQSLITRLIDERFADYEQAIPKGNCTTKAIIDRDALLSAVGLAIQMANKTTRQVMFDFSAEGLMVKTKDLDFDAKFDCEVPCVVEGSPLLIAFDGVLFKSILSVIESDEIILKITSATRCGVVNDGFLLMPIMVTEFA